LAIAAVVELRDEVERDHHLLRVGGRSGRSDQEEEEETAN
jgi:hypothetical protein